MGRRVNVPISTARAKLFQLADLVRSSDEDVVVVLGSGASQTAWRWCARRGLAISRPARPSSKRRDRQPFKLRAA